MISWTEEMQMIFPAAREISGRRPRRSSERAAAREQRNVPVRFTPSTVFHCSIVIVVTGASRWRPALFTRMSMPPHARSISANIASTSASFETSARIASASIPLALISSAIFAAASGFETKLTTTAAPAAPSARATPSPMPEFAPVTSARCPLSGCWSMAGSLSSLFRPPLDTRAYAAGSPSRRERSNPRPRRARLNRRKEVRDGASSVGLSRRLDLIPLVDLEGPAASDRPLHRLLRRGRAKPTRARGGTFRLDPAESRDKEGAGELRCPPIRVQVRLTLLAAAQMSLDLCARARAERRLEVLPEKRDRVPTGHRSAAVVMVLSLLRCLLDTQHRCRDSACPM